MHWTGRQVCSCLQHVLLLTHFEFRKHRCYFCSGFGLPLSATKKGDSQSGQDTDDGNDDHDLNESESLLTLDHSRGVATCIPLRGEREFGFKCLVWFVHAGMHCKMFMDILPQIVTQRARWDKFC